MVTVSQIRKNIAGKPPYIGSDFSSCDNCSICRQYVHQKHPFCQSLTKLHTILLHHDSLPHIYSFNLIFTVSSKGKFYAFSSMNL